MKKTYSIRGIGCNRCVGHVKEQIEKHPDVTQADVASVVMMNFMRKPKKAVITMNQHISTEELQRFLDKDSDHAGKYSISQA